MYPNLSFVQYLHILYPGPSPHFLNFQHFFFFFCLFVISRAAPVAYGGSQARG